MRARLPAALRSLAGVFALGETLLTLLGVYGMLAHAVSRCRGELRVRAAVGARRADLVRMVVREGAVLLLSGIAAGAFVALAASRARAGLVYGIGAADPSVYLAVAAGLVAFGLVACYLPARHPARLSVPPSPSTTGSKP